MYRGKVYLISALFFFVPLFAAADDQDLSITKLISVNDQELFPQSEINSTAEALNILFNGEEPPIDCASPVIQGLIHHYQSQGISLSPALKFLIDRPSLKEELIYNTPQGHFRIHYSKDRSTVDAIIIADKDQNGIPDYIETVGVGLEEARTLFIDQLGFNDPSRLSQSGQPCDIYIKNLGGMLSGFTVPLQKRDSRLQGKSFSFIVLDNLLVGDKTILKSIAAHQFAHAITYSYSYRSESWWSEATAIWLEDRLYSTLIRYYEALSYRLEKKNKALATDQLILMQGNALWPFFLSEKDVNLIRLGWEEIKDNPDWSVIQVFSQLLEKNNRGTLEDNFSDFCLWTYFTGSKDDGNHFLFASYLPDPFFDSSYSTYPIAGIQIENPIEPFGASFIQFESEKSGGALIINFEGDQHCQWSVDVLLVSDKDPRYYRARMSIDDSGHSSIGIPWEPLTDIIVVVKNLSMHQGIRGRFNYVATHDPSYPFELNFIEAVDEQGIIAVLWETDSETDLFGWNVYRSCEPVCDFSKINGVFIPALGESSAPVLYKFLDNSAQPSKKYFYYVEGITKDGLPSHSSVSSAEIEE